MLFPFQLWVNFKEACGVFIVVKYIETIYTIKSQYKQSWLTPVNLSLVQHGLFTHSALGTLFRIRRNGTSAQARKAD